MAKRISPIIVIYLVVFFLFRSIFDVYFTGDDFFHFTVAKTDGSIWGFVKLFWFYPFEVRGIAFYRPIFRELLYHVNYSFFGLNHLPFRILQMLIHFVNIFLVFLLAERIFKERKISLFSAFFYGISAANVATLYYIAGGVQAQGAAMFTLVSLILFMNGRKYLFFIPAVMALMSHEMGIVVTPLLAGWAIIERKRLLRLLPLLVITFTYLLLNYFVIGFSDSEVQYQISFNLAKLFNTLGWYIAWGMGLPEMLVDFVGSGFSLDPRLMKYWGSSFRVIFPSFFVSVAIILLSVINVILKKRLVLRDGRVWFLGLWFLVGLFPVAFLPWHKSSYYLATVLPALWILIGYIVYNVGPRLLLILAFSSLFLNVVSIELGTNTYPAAQRGRMAHKLINDFRHQYPNLPKGAVVYVINDPDYPFISEDWHGSSYQASLILSGSDAFRLLYNDPSIEVLYQDFSKNLPESEYIKFVARLE
ncbi:MAG: TPR domain protein [Candidatus Woesebacteria bacterium GW2011_GWB1_43_14]|uniref:TPR domain protein n=1 Tax=Candidatus Woesebacteria bacterium GW2011_GWB1_43_14 TaxID=1618578 RepID=A0A0G1FQG0_9BACT|nr:MAG: TPR domain protein [Candidatus Woesebacteria bacterium GW2011_GWA1_39_11b]KKS78316.1 MAG: TPR domain protein [Candidatus Woesebacteria bacterium GW2011_GWC1_42_9]KKS97266.1 MAG: TPR domain protein [Candidatus Woesebacteria bacterium GW2011_GWB1_43_14]